jgi:hypothetical protein
MNKHTSAPAQDVTVGRPAPFRICFEVPGNPVPKARPQVGSHGAYYPERSPRSKRFSYPDYLDWVRAQCWQALIPTGRRFSPELLWGLKVTAWVGAGDGDNILGSIADAIQENPKKERLGLLWQTDKQIAHWEADVIRTRPKEYRGLLVEAWALP